MYVKYPRTFHLPWSSGTNDDRILDSDDCFLYKNVVVTLKMDGENTTMYNSHIHARSIDSNNHISRDWVKGMWGNIAYKIPEGMRVCGENLYALHTVPYDDLLSYFLGFSIWIDNTCLSWIETLEYFKELHIEPVPVIYQGVYDIKAIEDSWNQHKDTHEGYVVRLANSFEMDNFHESIAKYVKPAFKQAVDASDAHWQQAVVTPNKLRL